MNIDLLFKLFGKKIRKKKKSNVDIVEGNHQIGRKHVREGEIYISERRKRSSIIYYMELMHLIP